MKLLQVVGVVVVGSLLLFGQPKKPDSAAVEKILVQMENEWSKAGTNKDVKTLERILADDWVGVDFQGKSSTKAETLADLKSGSSATQSYEMGPLKVRVFGDVAVVNGSQTEKSTWKGKNSSGKYVWTTVYVNRNGRWQAVATQATKVEQ